MYRYRTAAAILATTALCSPALAVDTNTDTGNINVSLTVVHDCVLEAEPLAFPQSGVIDRDVTAETTITIECTRDSAYQIGLSAGDNAGGSDINNRKLKLTGGNADDVLAYQLYSDENMTAEWGHTQYTNTVGELSADGLDNEYTVYGLIPQHQNAPAGSYTDIITATIWYEGSDLLPPPDED